MQAYVTNFTLLVKSLYVIRYSKRKKRAKTFQFVVRNRSLFSTMFPSLSIDRILVFLAEAISVRQVFTHFVCTRSCECAVLVRNPHLLIWLSHWLRKHTPSKTACPFERDERIHGVCFPRPPCLKI